MTYLQKLFSEYNKTRLNIYGHFQRACSAKNYTSNTQNYNMILTNYCLTSKYVILKVLEKMFESPYLEIVLQNKGNGEDLLFNYYFNKIFNTIPVYVKDENLSKLDFQPKPNHFEQIDKLCQLFYD